jgi:ubiquinone/menaquinone biosynthesis C-methylase UbiE
MVLVVFGALFVATVALVVYFSTREAEEMNLKKLLQICLKFRKVDFVKFTKEHWQAFAEGKKTNNYGPAVCHYYDVMAELITVGRGPYWHFVPIKPGVPERESHEQFHKVVVKYLDAKKGDDILELGAGFGECGRRVAHYSGANVTALTMADAEITGGNERIKQAGLDKQCRMVQGDYHEMSMFADNSFDAVFGIYCLKYSAKLDQVVKEAYRVLKPGGKFVVYCILTSDDYDPADKKQLGWVNWISESTGMPPLWSAKDYREVAEKVGFGDHTDTDIAEEGDLPWYRTFDMVFPILNSDLTVMLIKLAEVLGIVGRGFTEFYKTFLVHPSCDFVNAGRTNTITCTHMMKWVKQ